MIRLERVTNFLGKREFFRIGKEVYRKSPHHRVTDAEILNLLMSGKSAYFEHAKLEPFLIKQGRRTVGRVAIIHDERLSSYAQAAFFEALPDIESPAETIRLKAASLYPEARHLIVGLNGHLNYSAGFLANRFDEPPVFGLPYTLPYYLDYFDSFKRCDMVSFRFPLDEFYELRRRIAPGLHLNNITIRTMDRSNLAREVDIYTYLNNACFKNHPYWADRTSIEDFELFHPFRFLLKEENLIIAEENGRPVGFLLWYPDFNELVSAGETLGLTHVARYHLLNPIKTVRFTEIAVHPSCRNQGVVPGMIMQMAESLEKGGYRFCEGGFIFEENKESMGMTLRYIAKAFGRELETYREFCVFEAEV